MKTTTLALILFLTGSALWAQTVRQIPSRAHAAITNSATGVPAQNSGFNAPPAPPVPFTAPPTVANPPSAQSTASTSPTAGSSSPDGGGSPEKEVAGITYNWPSVDVNQVLDVYAGLVGRTILRAGLPSASITLVTQTPLTKSEAIEALQAVLALNGIALVNIGDKFVKAGPVEQANSFGAPLDRSDATNLPDLGSYVTHIVQLSFVKPSEMVPILTPFAKLANAIIPIDSNGILVLRDNAENVKRMLEMIQQIDVSVPAEIISEVIPIKYALADDIASALNSLGGTGGGGTVAIGTSTAPRTASGFASGTTGASGAGNAGSANGFTRPTGTAGATGTTRFGAQATATGTTAAGGPLTFQQRIQSLLQNATQGGQQQPIQILGQTKIIADERSNSLLIFASRQDMDTITNIVAKLDVLLSQVLIESVIMDVSLTKGSSFGVSVAQNPKSLSGSPSINTAGGVNNGQPFYNFLNSISNSFPGNFTSTLPGGTANSLSYFGNIGPTWDVALQAAASDGSVTVVQRPRIQTSQAKAAQFFVGSTVPYITGTSYGTGLNGANSSTYSQLSVGVELDVTPFINPDGLVVMDINQEIDDISGSTTIDGNSVPNTDKRTLSSEIAVKDGDTIILGGFIRTDKTKNKSGIPFLMNIPLLGNLFSSRTDTKDRQELIVLMRPTVLRSPEIAAAQAIKEEKRLPGISAADADSAADELKAEAAERKREQKLQSGSQGGSAPPVYSNPNSVLPVPNP
jgi:general secretion pathway protein D